jgi:Cleaved Adhesin Domain
MMRNIPSVATVLAALLLATGCPDDTNQNDSGNTEGEESSTGDSNTNPSTTQSDTTVSSTMTDPATTEAPETTMDPDSSSSDEGCTGECAIDDDCSPGQTCISCLCVGEIVGCDVWAGKGEYAECLLEDGTVDNTVCGGTGSCVVDDQAAPSAGVCFFPECDMPCDCPAPPEGFEAQVECALLTDAELKDCFIGCGEDGDVCPEGMFCVGDTICMFGDPPEPIPPYGDCLNLDGACDMSTCVSDMAGTLGWCGETCADADDDASCSAAPSGTATPDCVDVSNGMDAFFCALNCSEGDCPEGMTCLGGGLPICVWEPMVEPPPPVPGYGDCANNPDSTCLATETCLDDDGGGVCTETCTDAGDCEAAPETGDAPVACGDLGDGDTCYLDCSADQTCPDGMECLGASYCHWPSGGFLLDEDFEEGTFVPGWTLVDVDGFAHADQVSYIENPWSVENMLDGGTNFAAYSSSYYTPAGTSDDWLITPQFTPSATSTLSFEARAQDADFPDGYEVRVSTLGGTDTDDFMIEAVLLTVDAEEDAFTAHMIDLSTYDGMPIFIAFRNNSTDEFVLLLDNVQVTE